MWLSLSTRVAYEINKLINSKSRFPLGGNIVMVKSFPRRVGRIVLGHAEHVNMLRIRCSVRCLGTLEKFLGWFQRIPRGSGLLFFMFIRAQPYTCLGIEWLTQGGVESTIFHVYKGPTLHLFGN